MMIPVRCFTCGRVVASDWEQFAERYRRGESPKAILDALGVERYCCRRMIVAHVDLIDEVAPFT
ncbi:MAG TPA: DNA-directed RNA polymerase subunit N [Candidatus Thermoplasmatota archaeon]|jgi:DNA-directed RNA polymerase subunit N|nr:DNA-directed RNA polymerase subunit N [Candidatus Thermoplasmatota archaeon]